MAWDRCGQGVFNTKLDEYEIGVLFGHLNEEHSYLISKLGDLIRRYRNGEIKPSLAAQ